MPDLGFLVEEELIPVLKDIRDSLARIADSVEVRLPPRRETPEYRPLRERMIDRNLETAMPRRRR